MWQLQSRLETELAPVLQVGRIAGHLGVDANDVRIHADIALDGLAWSICSGHRRMERRLIGVGHPQVGEEVIEKGTLRALFNQPEHDIASQLMIARASCASSFVVHMDGAAGGRMGEVQYVIVGLQGGELWWTEPTTQMRSIT